MRSLSASRVRSALALTASLLVISSVVFVASRADGRSGSEVSSNDGGAWLVDRDASVVAHIEHATRQPTMRAFPGDGKGDLVVSQAAGVVVVHDALLATTALIEQANAVVNRGPNVPAGALVHARPHGVVVFDPAEGILWDLPSNEFMGKDSLPLELATVVGPPGSHLVVGRNGTIALVAGNEVLFAGTHGELSNVRLPEGFRVASATMIDSRLVVVSGQRWLVVTPDGFDEVELTTPISVQYLQQPNETWPLAIALQPSGRVASVNLSNGQVEEIDGGLAGPGTGAPIFNDGCLHALSRRSTGVRYSARCLRTAEAEINDDHSIESTAMLRLVNGFVWIDSYDGTGFVTSADLDLERIKDFSSATAQGPSLKEPDPTGEVKEELNPEDEDAQPVSADDFDPEQPPEPPIAVDDKASTRQARSVVVDVLANDSDRNGDVILIDEIEILDGIAAASITPTRDGIYVDPGRDAGQIELRYWITDGSSQADHRVSATLLVDVLPADAAGNRPPKPGIDRAVGAAGSTILLNVLDNDTDPEGDGLKLTGVDVEQMQGVTVLSVHPGGELTLALPEVTEGRFDIPYTVEDEWGATAKGTVIVELRLAGSNSPPDGRNDAGITQVGKRITLDLLVNDTDPENDRLFVLRSARPVGGPAAAYLSTSEDGEFVFEPTEVGTYRFEYTVSDRLVSDVAQIRVEVTDTIDNAAPVAVRDDIVLTQNEIGLVRVLDNDGDPDGDVVGIVEQIETNPNLEVTEQQGLGFWVKLRPQARSVETFTYRISDGHLESEPAQVIVSRSDTPAQNGAPVLVEDNFRVRPGRTSLLRVLDNDRDPDGDRLTIIEATLSDPEIGLLRIADGGQSLEVQISAASAQGALAAIYSVVDEAGNLATSQVDLSIIGPSEENSGPVARTDIAVTRDGEPVAITVLDNDDDVDGDSIRVVGVHKSPAHGVVHLTENGRSLLYTPAGGFRGTEQFTYLVEDIEGKASVGLVNVGVLPPPQFNRSPVARPDENYRYGATGKTAVLDVTANDFDPDGDELRILSVSGGAAVSGDGRSLEFDLPSEVDEQRFDPQLRDRAGRSI